MAAKINKIFQSEEVVISGISGNFPNSNSVAEFKENLLAGVDMTSSVNRWDTDDAVRMGALKTSDRFDYSFFHLTRVQAESAHLGLRLVLERTFEAIMDAGYNPQQLKGRNIAVICGTCSNGTKLNLEFNSDIMAYQEGKATFIFPNRVSYWLDIHGPSFKVDTDTASSLYAIDYGFKLIQDGSCEAAIVIAPNLCCQMPNKIYENNLLSSDGVCKSFDARGDGLTRAEAVVVMFLQKKKDARRIYANIVNSKTSCDGFKPEGISSPSTKLHKEFYEKFYQQSNIDPSTVSYVELQGIGAQMEDAAEGTLVEEFFCANRETPLKIGSICSNMGFSEAASGLCALTKMIVAFETRTIPPSLHYENPNPKIKGLQNGRLEMITKPTPLEGEYFGVNSFGLNGANGHILLTPHNKVKAVNDTSNDDDLPRLVTVSGRTEEAVECILNDIEKNHSDKEYIRLIHEIFSEDISGHLQRGYVILNNNTENVTSKKLVSGEKRPICFVFSGMGSQWPAMGKSLLKIPIFAESIQKSHEILQTKGLDLIEILTNDDPKIFDNILNSFVGIAAVQIALVDVLSALDVKPDKIIGHSVGELGCAYADGCFTAEQMILVSYYRGLVSLETEFIAGTMAAVGEGYKTLKDIIPPEIDIACRNSSTSCTISGPTEKVQDFIEVLKQKDIFVRPVNTSNIAYHSRYIASAAPKFMSYLKNIIPEPKPRSDRWICSSALEQEWDCEKIKFSSAEYHANNLLSPVYFEESCIHIPENAITIEIAPHSLLNPILKRSLPKTIENIPLTLKNHENMVQYFLNALGKMYEEGCAFKLSNLYPPIEFPVSASTPMISPLIKWQHEEKWSMWEENAQNFVSGDKCMSVNVQKDNFKYLKGHIIDGRNFYPHFGYLGLIWETAAKMQKKKLHEVSMVFENVRFEQVTIIPKKGAIKFNVTMHLGTHHFEITMNRNVVASGFARVLETPHKEIINVTLKTDTFDNNDNMILTSDEFYKELRSRGYYHEGLFRKVTCANFEGTFGKALWCDNFVAFMDTMTQIMALNTEYREPLVPVFVRRIVIDVQKHSEMLETLDKEAPEFSVDFNTNTNLLYSGGIQMFGLTMKEILRRSFQINLLLEKYEFVPYISDEQMNINEATAICVEIALENIISKNMKIYEILDDEYTTEIQLISDLIWKTLKKFPSVRADINVLMKSEKVTRLQRSPNIKISIGDLPNDKSCSLVIVSNTRNKYETYTKIFNALQDDGFIIAKEPSLNKSYMKKMGFHMCFSRDINAEEKVFLLNKINVNKHTFKSIGLNELRCNLQGNLEAPNNSVNEASEKLIIYKEKESIKDALKFFEKIRKEKGYFTRCCFIMDENAPSFSLKDPFYKSQLDKNLSYNVYKNGRWGSYRYLTFNPQQNTIVNHSFCKLEKRADLSSFKWLEDTSMNETKTKSLVRVYYSGLNFHDIMVSFGIISLANFSHYNCINEGCQGIEYSGKDSSGRRLMGMVRSKGIATTLETLPNFTWTVPDDMSLEAAASIPVAYCTVILAFFFKIQIEQGISVLIHTGNSNISQAAINICLHYKCEIFVTVDSVENAEFVKKIFPQIPENHICNYNTMSFEKFIIQQTNGNGVDVVFNNLTSKKLQASLRCLGANGHFLELEKKSMLRNNPLGLGHFMNNITFHSINLDFILWQQNDIESKLWKKLQEMLDQGILKPIQTKVFHSNEVESAFRYVATEKHPEKVVIKIRDEEGGTKPNLIQITAEPYVLCKSNESYLIIGDLDEFHLEFTNWLISRGARNIVLNSQSGFNNGYQSYKMKQWRSYGINVITLQEDITQETGVINLLQKTISLGSVGGIFNILMDPRNETKIYKNNSTLTAAVDAKLIATVHLDNFSRKLCSDLEYFVIFSSPLDRLEAVNETQFQFDSSVLENICESRRANNLPALIIQWEAIKENLVSNSDNENNFIPDPKLQQDVKYYLNSLDSLLKQTNPIVVAEIVGRKCKTADFNIIHKIANILGIENYETMDVTKKLMELGMNSTLTLELQQIIESEINISFTLKDLQNITTDKLCRLVEEKLNTSVSSDKEVESQCEPEIIDEKIIHEPIIQIPFKSEEINANQAKGKRAKVFVFPGLEGIAQIMEPLAKNLNLIQTFCFQYHHEDISTFKSSKLREYFSKHILEQLEPDEEYKIIGHNLGSLFALETVSFLEKIGKKGHLWLIDSSPSYLMKIIAQHYPKNILPNEESLQKSVCSQLIESLFLGMDVNKYLEVMQENNDTESNQNLCVSFLSRLSQEDMIIKKILNKMNDLIRILMDYEISETLLLESSCILIRTSDNLYNMDETYDLTKYFKNPIQVHHVEANHYSIIRNSKTAQIIMESPIWKKICEQIA